MRKITAEFQHGLLSYACKCLSFIIYPCIHFLCLWKFTFRDFPKPDLGLNIGFAQFKNELNLPLMVYIIPNFLVLHFGENANKSRKVADS